MGKIESLEHLPQSSIMSTGIQINPAALTSEAKRNISSPHLPGNDVSPNAAEKKPAGQDWRRPQREGGKRKTLPMQSLSRKNQILATSYSPTGFCSTIGAGELNFRVRDGNGCGLSAIVTRKYDYVLSFA